VLSYYHLCDLKPNLNCLQSIVHLSIHEDGIHHRSCWWIYEVI